MARRSSIIIVACFCACVCLPPLTRFQRHLRWFPWVSLARSCSLHATAIFLRRYAASSTHGWVLLPLCGYRRSREVRPVGDGYAAARCRHTKNVLVLNCILEQNHLYYVCLIMSRRGKGGSVSVQQANGATEADDHKAFGNHNISGGIDGFGAGEDACKRTVPHGGVAGW